MSPDCGALRAIYFVTDTKKKRDFMMARSVEFSMTSLVGEKLRQAFLCLQVIACVL
jgi:hypothetical protein